jgi:acetyl-CoA acetyltransferase
VIEAVDAVAAGRCRYALVWRALNQPRYGPWTHQDWAGRDQFLGPYGYYRVIHDHAMAFTRYCALSSCSRADTARLTMAQRRNAALNPNAFFRDVTLTLDDYLAAPMISDPLCRFDCDIPVQGGWAAVIAGADAPRRSAHQPAYVRAAAQQTSVMIGESLIYALADHIEVGGPVCDALYREAGLGPGDIQVAQFYDGFSSSVYYWLEAAGFCGRGEGPAHLARMIEKHPDLLPVNTHGGSLSEGRSHGMGHIVEAARQVFGAAPPTRQVAGVETAIAFTGAPAYHSAGLILSRSPGW